MDFNELFQRGKAIQKLLNIERDFETLGKSGLFLLRGKRSSEELKGNQMQALDPEEQEIIRIYGRNIKIQELRNILESEPWIKGFNPSTSKLMKRYGFLTDSSVVYETLRTPNDETIEAFKTSGVISQTTLREIIDCFRTPEATIKFRENLVNIFKVTNIKTNYATNKESTDGSMASNAVLMITQQIKDSQALDTISAAREKKSLELKVLRDIQENAEDLKFACIKRRDCSQKLPNLFPTFLKNRTEVFMFPSFPVDKVGDKIMLKSYQDECETIATHISLNIVEFCQQAKVASAMIISLFELFFSFKFQSSSPLESDCKKVVQEFFGELCVLECEIVEQKQRCIKFLIDVDIFLYHDSPLPITGTVWTNQQIYTWKLATTRAELAIHLLDVLVCKLKEAQSEFIQQYKKKVSCN